MRLTRWSAVEAEVHGGIFVLTDKAGEYKYCSWSSLSPYFLYDLVVLLSKWLCGCSLCHLTAQEPPAQPLGLATHQLVGAELCLVCAWPREEQTPAWLECCCQRGDPGITHPVPGICCFHGAAGTCKGRLIQPGKKGFASQNLCSDTWQWDQGGDWIAESARRQGRNPGAQAGRMLVHLRPPLESSFLLNQDVEDVSAFSGWCYWNVGFGKCFRKQEKPVNRYVMCSWNRKVQIRLSSWDAVRRFCTSFSVLEHSGASVPLTTQFGHLNTVGLVTMSLPL